MSETEIFGVPAPPRDMSNEDHGWPPKDKPKITGYRTLTDAEIAIINRVKAKAEEVRGLLVEVQQHNALDHRWLAIGQTDLQKGFMAVIRAIARPETF